MYLSQNSCHLIFVVSTEDIEPLEADLTLVLAGKVALVLDVHQLYLTAADWPPNVARGVVSKVGDRTRPRRFCLSVALRGIFIIYFWDEINDEGCGPVLKCLCILILANLIPVKHLDTPRFLLLESKFKPICVLTSSVFGTIKTSLTENGIYIIILFWLTNRHLYRVGYSLSRDNLPGLNHKTKLD